MSENTWWFGKGSIGDIVFDKSIQLGDESVLLYVLKDNNVQKFLADEMMKLLQPQKNEEIVKRLAKSYKDWREFYSSRLMRLAAEKPFS